MTAPIPGVTACVFLDLDGTLLDTAPDMARALNHLLLEQGRPPLAPERIRPMVSHGTPGLIALGFGLTPESENFAGLRQRFLDLYSAALAVDTALFAGMDALLGYLETRAIPWGIVTNKPGWLTDRLLRALGLYDSAACVVSGDTVARRKPDPEPLLYACRLVGVTPAQCCYVGDAERDIQAGNRAGMTTWVARFGYLADTDRPETWGAFGLLDTPNDLLSWLAGRKEST